MPQKEVPGRKTGEEGKRQLAYIDGTNSTEERRRQDERMGHLRATALTVQPTSKQERLE